MAGWCAMSVPLYRSFRSGLPIGVHFAAPQGADAELFDLAYELEAATPWLSMIQACSDACVFRC